MRNFCWVNVNQCFQGLKELRKLGFAQELKIFPCFFSWMFDECSMMWWAEFVTVMVFGVAQIVALVSQCCEWMNPVTPAATLWCLSKYVSVLLSTQQRWLWGSSWREYFSVWRQKVLQWETQCRNEKTEQSPLWRGLVDCGFIVSHPQVWGAYFKERKQTGWKKSFEKIREFYILLV